MTSVDVVAVAEGVVEALEKDDARAVGKDCSSGLFVEGAAMAVLGENAVGGEVVAFFLGESDGDAAGHGHVAGVGAQALARGGDGDEGSRASGLHRHGGTAQIELKGDAGGEVVLVVAKFGLQGADLDLGNPVRKEFAVGGEIGKSVGVEVVAGPESDFSFVFFGIVTGVFEAVPSEFEEDPMLGVHELGLVGEDSEEFGVEVFDVFHEAFDGHVTGVVADLGGVDVGGEKFFVGQLSEAFLAVDEVLPENLHVGGLGETAGHADDGDVAALVVLAGGSGLFGGSLFLFSEELGLGGDGGVLEELGSADGFVKVASVNLARS